MLRQRCLQQGEVKAMLHQRCLQQGEENQNNATSSAARQSPDSVQEPPYCIVWLVI